MRYINNPRLQWLMLLLPILLISSFVVLAQPAIRFSPISQQHEMSQTSANTLWQDKQGFMWIDTQDGLNRYDGYGFKKVVTNTFDYTKIKV